MKILISITNLEVGGAQIFVLNLASSLAQNNTVYLYDHRPEDRDKELVKKLLSPKVKLFSYASHPFALKVIWKINKIILQLGIKFHFRDFINDIYYRMIIRKYKPDIIHSHLNLSDVNVTRNTDGTPIIITVHGCYNTNELFKCDWYTQNALKSIPLLMKKIRGIIYLYDKSIEAFIPYFNNRNISLSKIYTGFHFPSDEQDKVDIRKQFNIDKNDLIFVMLARGVKEKGWEEGIKSFLNIKNKSNNNIYLFLIGDSSYLQNLKTQYRSYKNIVFLGKVINPIRIIANCDIGILPSYSECLPNVIIEYLYCGLPVIATNVGEIESMITYNGLKAGTVINLLPNGYPDIESFSNVMTYYVNNPEFRKQQQFIAKKAAEKFSMERCVKEHYSFYCSILDKK